MEKWSSFKERWAVSALMCHASSVTLAWPVCGVNVHNRVVILGPRDISRRAGLHLADEGGVVIHQNIQRL